MRDYAPLVVFVYNRPEHTLQTLQALNDNTCAENTDLFLFADSAKNEKAQPAVAEVRKVIHDFSESCRFRSVTITEAEENKGLRKSVITGVTEVIRKYGKVIVVEDDLLTRKNFLQFMNDALNLYERDHRIWSIAGHTRDFPQLKETASSIYLTRRACSWGWGTWLDRWETIDWEVSDYESFRRNPYRRWRFARGGGDLYKMLENEMNGKSSSWALRQQYSMAKTDMFTVYPTHTFVYNIGFDGSGTHCTVTENESFDNLDAQPYLLIPNVQFDASIDRGFRRAEYPSLYKRGIRKLKRILNRQEPK